MNMHLAVCSSFLYTDILMRTATIETGTSISANTADWTRENPTHFWDPSRKLLHTIRRYRSWREGKSLVAAAASRSLVLRHRFWSVVTGADIPLNCDIGGGLLMPHPNGIVIHPQAKIGVNCLILQQVTIAIGEGGAPQIEGHVDIGAGARILGPVKIGAHAKIGANAVVLTDVPENCTAVGVPARCLPSLHPKTAKSIVPIRFEP
jgi:serine O-acetyltransferase